MRENDRSGPMGRFHENRTHFVTRSGIDLMTACDIDQRETAPLTSVCGRSGDRSIDAKRDVGATRASVGRTRDRGGDANDDGVEWTFWIVTVDYASRVDVRRADDGD